MYMYMWAIFISSTSKFLPITIAPLNIPLLITWLTELKAFPQKYGLQFPYHNVKTKAIKTKFVLPLSKKRCTNLMHFYSQNNQNGNMRILNTFLPTIFEEPVDSTKWWHSPILPGEKCEMGKLKRGTQKLNLMSSGWKSFISSNLLPRRLGLQITVISFIRGCQRFLGRLGRGLLSVKKVKRQHLSNWRKWSIYRLKMWRLTLL